MARNETTKLAQNFLKDQAAIIKKHGNTPKMSGQNFRRVMNDTKRTFEHLRIASGKFTSV